MRAGKWGIWLLGAVLIGALGAWWLLRPRPTDREQIERVVDQIEKGVESKRPGHVLGQISADYHDSSGATKTDLRRLSLALMRSEVSVEVTIDRFEFQVHGRDAEGTAEVGILARGGGADVRASGPVRILFAKERKGWKVTSAEGWQAWARDIY